MPLSSCGGCFGCGGGWVGVAPFLLWGWRGPVGSGSGGALGIHCLSWGLWGFVGAGVG